MDEYVVGAVADIISGNLTPNRPSNVKKAKTPIKHQPSPQVTPRSEAVLGREALLSPTLLRKKAVAKKSPKRIFEKEDLDKTAEEKTSPKADKVKKHLQNDLDSNKNEYNSSKVKHKMEQANTGADKIDTLKKNKKNKKYSEADINNSENDSNVADVEQNLNVSKNKKRKIETRLIEDDSKEVQVSNLELSKNLNESKSSKRKKELDSFITEDKIVNENIIVGNNLSDKKEKKTFLHSSEQTFYVSSVEKDGNLKENKKIKKIKNKSNSVDNAPEISENIEETFKEAEPKKKKKKKNMKKNKQTTILKQHDEEHTDSEHNSDDEIESETEQDLKQILDSGPIEGDDSSDSEEKPKQKKSKSEKKIEENKVNGNTEEDGEAKRTLFVGNVPLSKKCKKEIKKIFNKYGTIQSVRIRAVPVKDMRTKPKVAAIKNDIHPDRSSVNVYVKFADASSVTKALAENNRVMSEHHLRVTRGDRPDSHDARRALFVGNIPLGIEDEALRRTFERCGQIESVRVVRDRVTQLGKGFGYVNFKSSDGVELALNLTDEDLTIKNRILRVRRYTQTAPGHKVKARPGSGSVPGAGGVPGGGRRQAAEGKDGGAFRRIQNKRKYQEHVSEKSEKNARPDEQVKQKKAKKEFVGVTAEKKKKNKKKFDKQSKRKRAIAEILTK